MTYVDGNNFINHYLITGEPCAVGKIGVTELKLLWHYINQNYTPEFIKEAQDVSGIFPYSLENYNEFAKLYLASLKQVDALAIWNKILSQLEFSICSEIGAKPIRLQDIEPYFHNPPWSLSLEGKNVLVISPFANTISQQYQQREKIWPNRILPEFHLSTIRFPNSATVNSQNHFASIFDLIRHTEEQMDKIKYDVALVGIGAASIPLISHAKLAGKIGIHMGGPTQILFGIKGKRWDDSPEFQKFFNEYWVRPSKDETPEKVDLVEGACYW